MRRHMLPLAALLLAAGPADADARPPRGGLDRPAETSGRPSGQVDLDRLLGEPAYAEQFLRGLDASEAATTRDPEARLVFLGIRALALAGARRAGEAGAAVDALLAERARDPSSYMLGWIAAGTVNDIGRMVAVAEAASRNVPAAGRSELYVLLPPEQVFTLARQLAAEGREAERDRLYDALAAIDWPGELQPESRDAVRMNLVDRHLARRDRDAAARIARTIAAPAQLLPLLTTRKYDGLLDPADPLATFRDAQREHDRVTAAAVAARPDDLAVLVARAQHLRGVGRYADVLALLSPHLADVPATFAAESQGMWVINEAAFALLDLGRGDEAAALMERLIAQDIEARPGLIGPSINHIELLRAAGRPADALAHAERLRIGHGPRYANGYGERWIDEGTVCALAALGRTAEAAPHLARLRARRDDNPAALSRALLCVGAEDEAAALMVRRLGSADPAEAITALQQFELQSAADRDDPLTARLDALRARPEVAAALARVGRSLRLPLSRSYWGSY